MLPIIEQVKQDDLDTILAWTIQLHHHEDDGELKSHANFEINLRKWLEQEITNPNSLFLVAKCNGLPVGFIAASSIINDNGFLDNPLKGEVNLLWVEDKYRKQKIAEQLLLETEKCLLSTGINYIECHYTSNNQLAKAFWDKKGYQQRAIIARKML